MSSAYQSDWKLVVNRLFYKTFGVTWNSHVNVLVPVSVGETISGKFELLVESKGNSHYLFFSRPRRLFCNLYENLFFIY